ncbi:MAG: hypothetical protein ABW034_23795 [Steroidobacteraceae bacterium]
MVPTRLVLHTLASCRAFLGLNALQWFVLVAVASWSVSPGVANAGPQLLESALLWVESGNQVLPSDRFNYVETADRSPVRLASDGGSPHLTTASALRTPCVESASSVASLATPAAGQRTHSPFQPRAPPTAPLS